MQSECVNWLEMSFVILLFFLLLHRVRLDKSIFASSLNGLRRRMTSTIVCFPREFQKNSLFDERPARRLADEKVVKMAALVKFTRVATKLSQKSSLGAVVSVRNHWNKDLKPAPYPETQKEREAAAKKYGIPIEEYQPYPDDGMGFGDYPKLKDESVELRDPFYHWDYPEHKRNFNDPIHAELDAYSEDRYNTGKRI